MPYLLEHPDNQETSLRSLTSHELQTISDLLLAATLDGQICQRLLGQQKQALFEECGFSPDLQAWLCRIHARTIQEFAQKVLKQQTVANERLFRIE